VSVIATAGGGADAVTDAALLLFGSAQILDGDAPSDPSEFNARLVAAMQSLYGSASAAADEEGS